MLLAASWKRGKSKNAQADDFRTGYLGCQPHDAGRLCTDRGCHFSRTDPGGGADAAIAWVRAREALFFDLYAAALYLPRAGLGQDEILAASTPKAVQLKILYGDLPDNIPQSWSEPLDRMVREELEQTVREIYANFESGDEVRIVYAPEMGARLIVNGAVRREMPDDDGFRPLLRLWIGEEAVSKNLRRLLLSGDCG